MTKTRDAQSIRTDVDIRSGMGGDERNKPSRSMDYTPGGGGPKAYPGDGSPNSDLLHGGYNQANSSIRDVRVGDIPGYGGGDLGSMELAGRVQSIPKVPAMQQVITRPMLGAGPLEMQRLEQQQKNAIAMGDPDYAPLHNLDYESIKDSNFTVKPGRSASRTDKDFTR